VVFVKQDGEEQKLSYEEFIRAIQEGRVTAETLVRSDVLTAGLWKPAGQVRLFQAWVPKERKARTEDASRARELPIASPEGEGVAPEPQPAWDAEEPAEGEPDEVRPLTEGPKVEPSDEHPSGDLIPWEQAEQIGFGAGLVATLWLAFRDTEEFFRRIGRSESLLPPLLFGLILFAIANLADGIYGYLILSNIGGAFEEMKQAFPGVFDEEVVSSPRDFFFSHGAFVLLYPILVFLWTGVAHLLLRAFERPAKPLSGTFRVANYSMAPLILSIVPVCGNIIGWIWVVVLMARGLVRVQRVGGGSAALAVLLPFLVPVCLAASSLVKPMVQLLSTSAGGF